MAVLIWNVGDAVERFSLEHYERWQKRGLKRMFLKVTCPDNRGVYVDDEKVYLIHKPRTVYSTLGFNEPSRLVYWVLKRLHCVVLTLWQKVHSRVRGIRKAQYGFVIEEYQRFMDH